MKVKFNCGQKVHKNVSEKASFCPELKYQQNLRSNKRPDDSPRSNFRLCPNPGQKTPKNDGNYIIDSFVFSSSGFQLLAGLAVGLHC